MKRIINMGPDVYPAIGESRLELLEKFLKTVPSRTKHGPRGSGEIGPCDEGCVKCEAEKLLTPPPPTEDEPKMFAVWCTVSDCFHVVDGEWSWTTAQQLQDDFDREVRALVQKGARPSQIADLQALRDRCVGLAKGSGY